MDFKTLLIYLPAADFTQPYPAIPYLASYLREKGETVTIKDANIEGFQYILCPDFLKQCQQKIMQRFANLETKNSLNYLEQKEYLKCLEALGINQHLLESDFYISFFRNKEAFFDFKAYNQHTKWLMQALTLISGAYFPTIVEPGGYSTPFFLSSRADITEQTEQTSNPFIHYYEEKLIPLIETTQPDLIGLSITYPTQILQMFACAALIKQKFPHIHICVGGAFITRLVVNMPRKKLKTLFDFIDSIVLYEGENALHSLISYLKAKAVTPKSPAFAHPNVIYYDRPRFEILFPHGEPFLENMDELPPPDYHGFPLESYFSPKVVLPYAPTRGCYWNQCAFCHYGATKEGTALYKERSINKIIADMEFLAKRHDTTHFAFFIDVMSPALSLKIADQLIKRKLPFLWNSEIKIEKTFTPENCQKLKQGGCLSVALGLESGCLRILDLINKGYSPQTAKEVIKNFADAGIAVQVMSFMDFPTETTAEALQTLSFIGNQKDHISLFTFGEFVLLPGSAVYKNPAHYDISHVHYSPGDEFRTVCLYKNHAGEAEKDSTAIDAAYFKVASAYAGLEFPFVGSVSSNHTFLYLEHFGKDAFKNPEYLINQGDDELPHYFTHLSRPRLAPTIKIREVHFSFREINEIQESHSGIIKESMDKNGISYRQALYKILNKTRVYPQPSYVMLIEDVKWSECPLPVKQILDLCNGENTVEWICNSQGEKARDFIKSMLNQLLASDILEDNQLNK